MLDVLSRPDFFVSPLDRTPLFEEVRLYFSIKEEFRITWRSKITRLALRMARRPVLSLKEEIYRRARSILAL